MYAAHMSDGPAPAQNAIVTRATITELVSRRDTALSKLIEARDRLHEALQDASEAGGSAWPGLNADMIDLLMSKDKRDDFVKAARSRIDQASWRHVVFAHGFDKIMDRQALLEFDGQLAKDPPVFDLETTEATMRQLVVDADRLMRRGIANAFSKLDRRFRSHDGFKIGSKIILSYAFTEYGSWTHGRNHDDTLRDIERILMHLDGKETPERYAGIVGLIDQARSGSYGRFSCDVRNEYMRAKAFKNGNLHVWFVRDDLIEGVNRHLAEYYGEVLGEGVDAKRDDPLAEPTTSVVRNMGWFPTPLEVAQRAAGLAEVAWSPKDRNGVQETYRVLEPSAGEGALIRSLRASAMKASVPLEIVAIEMHPDRAATLRRMEEGPMQVVERDFLTVRPEETGLFDRIVMNPPFDRQNDIAHVVHASTFLAPGGRLVAIMSASVEFRDDRRTVAFREMIERHGGRIEDLPAGSFESSGTMVNTCMVLIKAPRKTA